MTKKMKVAEKFLRIWLKGLSNVDKEVKEYVEGDLYVEVTVSKLQEILEKLINDDLDN